VGLVPGSFDPITRAHLALADAALQLVDAVVLLYSVRTLPKEAIGPGHEPLLSERQRLDVLIEVSQARARTAAAVCSHGLLVDQLRAARRRWPRPVALSFVVGSDKLLQVFDPKWYDDRDRAVARLFQEANVLFAVRVGDEPAVDALMRSSDVAPWLGHLGRLGVPADVAAISSRTVRKVLRSGGDVSALVPPQAAAALGFGERR